MPARRATDMTDLPQHPRRQRQRLEAISRRILPWLIRADLEQTSRSLRMEIETLNELVNSVVQSGHANALRWDHLDNHLVRMSNDLTAMIGSHLAENAASHDLLREQIGHAEAVLGRLTRSGAPLLGGVALQRNALHTTLAWFPTWSALAPLDVEPLVSVVIPTRNRRSLLETALASLARQTYTNWEAVVVNDGSTDDTGVFLRTLSEHDSRIRVIEATGVGPGGARQLGLEQADGDVIAYLDDDNLMSDGWLRAVVEVFGRQPELNAVYGAQLREVDATEPWLLLEPFDELRLLEGNFIDIGAFAHRPIGGVAHRPDVRGLEDWDFILAVSETHTPVPLPVIASVYLTRAGGRRTLVPDQYEVEEFVRSSAVRKRLADTEFVERAIRAIADGDPLSNDESADAVTGRDVEMLLNTVRSISQRRAGPIWILEWGTSQSSETIRRALPDFDVHWLSVRHSVHDLDESVDSSDTDKSTARFDASTADANRIRKAALGSPLTEIWFAVDPSSDAEQYDLLPAQLGIEFDVILIDGPAQRERLRHARDTISSTGLVLLHGQDPSWHDTRVDEFESWCPIGDAFWVGSVVDTDFTDVVPFRALLRGVRRTRLHVGEAATPLQGDGGTCD